MSPVADKGVSVVIDQNKFLAVGATVVDAIITVEATADLVATAPPQERVEVLVIDSSGSMASGGRFEGARDAVYAALDVLTDGTRFAIIEGTDTARVAYPTEGASEILSRRTRDAARKALQKMRAGGGTAIGTWLGLTRIIAQQHPDAMVHAVLLTDGKDEHETAEQLAEEIRAAQGLFTCDCRGIGTDWRVDELRSIASALNGTIDAVEHPHQLAEFFTDVMKASMAKAIPELTLRVWTPADARIRFIKQVAPTIENFTDRRVDRTAQEGEYALGPWGVEDRDYHIQLELKPPADLEREKRAAKITVFADDQPLGDGQILAVWTDDTERSARISKGVAHYTGQAELAQAVQEGLEARERGDITTATAKLQRAVELADESGNGETAKLLRKVVDVDPHTGTVRLRSTVAPIDEMKLNARSTKTARIRKTQEP